MSIHVKLNLVFLLGIVLSKSYPLGYAPQSTTAGVKEEYSYYLFVTTTLLP